MKNFKINEQTAEVIKEIAIGCAEVLLTVLLNQVVRKKD